MGKKVWALVMADTVEFVQKGRGYEFCPKVGVVLVVSGKSLAHIRKGVGEHGRIMEHGDQKKVFLAAARERAKRDLVEGVMTS
jgi:hypothetical protein